MVLKDSFTAGTVNVNGFASNLMQSFTANSSYILTDIAIELATTTTGNEQLEIWSSDVTDLPITLLGTSSVFTIHNNGSVPTYYTFTGFSISITSGSKYVIAVKTIINNSILWVGSSSSSYAGGRAGQKPSTLYSSIYDFNFKTFGTSAPTGYSKKVNGITPSKVNGVVVANIGKVNGI